MTALPFARYETRGDGYCRWRAWTGDRERYVLVHQLLAIAHGADPDRVFSDGRYQVHHRNGVRYDNRASNLEVVDGDRHGRHHLNGQRLEGSP